MQAEVIERDPVDVVGYAARINPMEADYRTIWETGFGRLQRHLEPLAVEPGYYAVYFGTDEDERVDLVAGIAAAPGDSVPEGATRRPLPGGTYASFDCRMATIGTTWQSIYRDWLPGSGYAEDPTRPGIERFPPEGAGHDAPVKVMIAIKPA